ncbi:hypothetical protein D9758_007813 [Tetrapyrgos nigripes]|uniref:Heme peroxidase n=1 Tax=Tetrapyrgos nigripes TaxID=182062 RepID=A0A8H5CZJ4_9AGAR|nr:hypothetical protein D9758_007813 [Tetrapyrgos nigripes]
MFLNKLSPSSSRQSSQAERTTSGNGDTKPPKSALDYSNVHHANALSAGIDFLSHSEGIDDRKLALEFGLSYMSKHPTGEVSKFMQDDVIQRLYNDLPHPPSTVIGEKYAWRSADGSGNNVTEPELGKSGTTYSRSVQQTHLRPARELPDAGLLFDTLHTQSLLKREGFVKHPAGLSSLMFSFAALVIHTVFRTSHEQPDVNDTSSYVDLSPLYGSTQEDQDKVRMRDGRGRLWPDVFAEDRLLLLPPAVCVLLVLFCRNHNYITEKLFDINERGNYVDPSQLSGEKLAAQDEELFQTARLINVAWFGAAVFSDYLSCILGLVRQGSNWSLNPFGEMRKLDHSLFERGRGNAVSVEFNCLYRWHATTSEHDEEWISQMATKMFGKDPETLQISDFKALALKLKDMDTDLHAWTFGGMKRQENGYFKDEDLAALLKTATDQPAGAFRARGTPANMRLHEIMGIENSRRWGVCSLNDFRKFLGLKTYSTFREWNPDPEIADAAEKLYGHIDNLELYVGLQAEESKPVVDGAGLCPGYTISRAILSDAIALTRGDRFFTQDFTPFNFTTWGFADCQRDPNAFGFGSTLGRLFLRTLPNQFKENSTYAFFPLMTPDAMGQHLKTLKVADKYDLSKDPMSFPFVSTSDYAQVGGILSSSDFTAQYHKRSDKVINGKGFFTDGSDPERESQVLKAITQSDSEAEILEFFYQRTRTVIQNEAFSLSGASNSKAVDIVRDVLKAVPIHWAADLAGISLTTKSSEGQLSVTEMYDMLGDIYTYIFLDVEHSKIMLLQEKVKTHVEKLCGYIESGTSSGGLRKLFEAIFSLFGKSKKSEQHDIVNRIQEIGHSTDETTNTILALMVGVSVELSIALTNVVNFYLDSEHHVTIQGSSKDKMEQTGPPFQGAFRTAEKDLTVSGLSVKKGAKVFLDIASAHQNEQTFPDPNRVNLSRDPKARLPHDRISKCLGEPLTMKIIGEVLRAVLELPNVRRGAGNSGTLKRFKDSNQYDIRWAYLDQQGSITAWPASMIIQFDAQA